VTSVTPSGHRAGEDDGEAPQAVALSPTARFRPLTAEELAVIAEIGRHWEAALGGRRFDRSRLPIDPDLALPRPPRRSSRFERIAEVDGFVQAQPGELVSTDVQAGAEPVSTRVARRLRRLVLGPPLATSALIEERLSNVKALAILSSDALSSVAYGTEAMLAILLMAGTTGLAYSLAIAAVILVLMITVGASYRQTIRAYPSGGGSYIVATDNLGRLPGLTAAAGLMVDYILTVSVSVAAGVAAVTSGIPELRGYSVPLGLACILAILVGNLRGIRQSGTIFAAPTYIFVAAMLALIAAGLVRTAARGWTALPPPNVPALEGVTLLLVLRAFASGASAMTGIEAISNGIPVFHPPEWRNARTTMTWMVALLGVMFAGITLLAHFEGVVPRSNETLLSQLATRIFGRGPVYGLIQASTALILVLAANTAFNDFPRLLFFLARDRYAPSMFCRLGDRLAHSNGIILLGIVAGALLVAFGGQTDRLIALYAVGVFLAFTLSQTGMVVRWLKRHGPGWRRGLTFNLFGAVLSAGVVLVIAIAKFTEGAWTVVILVPLLVMGMRQIGRHYECADDLTTPKPLDGVAPRRVIVPPRQRRRTGEMEPEQAESPDEIQHLVIVPVSWVDLPTLRALAYAASLNKPVLALHVSPDEQDGERFRHYWNVWGDHIPLEVIVSPYRLITLPLARYIRTLRARRPDLTITLVLPHVTVRHRWQGVLHNQTAQRLGAALRQDTGVVVASVPFHLSEC